MNTSTRVCFLCACAGLLGACAALHGQGRLQGEVEARSYRAPHELLEVSLEWMNHKRGWITDSFRCDDDVDHGIVAAGDFLVDFLRVSYAVPREAASMQVPEASLGAAELVAELRVNHIAVAEELCSSTVLLDEWSGEFMGGPAAFCVMRTPSGSPMARSRSFGIASEERFDDLRGYVCFQTRGGIYTICRAFWQGGEGLLERPATRQEWERVLGGQVEYLTFHAPEALQPVQRD